MTLPTLIQNNKKTETGAKLKKFYSAMNQALVMSTNEHGDIQYWNKLITSTADDAVTNKLNNAAKGYDFFMTYLAPYLKYLSVDKAEEVENPEDMKNYEVRVNFTDGTRMYIHFGGCIDMRFDTNGDKNPNKEGKDIFTFVLCTSEPYQSTYGKKNRYFTTYMQGIYATREEALAHCKNYPERCSSLLLFDNWEFKNDYPYKL